MNKEVEEAIETLKEFIEINQAITCESLTNEDRINSLRCKAELTILNYIKDSTPNSAIRKKKEKLEKEYKQALEKKSTKAFILKCQIEILEEILKEGEK